MNYLAHLYLAKRDPGLLVGGFLGDFVKGQLNGEIPHNIERGIRLHRAIDRFTDHHPLMPACREVLPKGSRRVSGIIIDVVFDHFLALSWADFSEIDLAAFDRETFERLLAAETRPYFPSVALNMCLQMQARQSLLRSLDPQFVETSLVSIGRRLRRGDRYFSAAQVAEIRARWPNLRPFFDEFFASTLVFVDNWCTNSTLKTQD